MCVHFPKWPLQRLRSERPELSRSEVVLFSGRKERLSITMCSPRANRHGLHIGQPLAEAKALLPKAVFLPDDVNADRTALAQLALDCQRFSPLVGLEEGLYPESLLADVTGCTDLWHGEDRFLEAVRSYWQGRRYHIQLALACSIGSAWALAHTAAISLVSPGGEEAALAGLSVAALRLPPEVLERLDALGLWTIGDVLRLPRESLASRFGVILPKRLDQVLGHLPETFICERLKEPLKVLREWETPIDDRFALACLCRQMLQELLSLAANRHGMGLQELEGELRTETGPVPIEIRLVEPTRDERHLAQLVELQLERRTWTGGVVAIEWTAHGWAGSSRLRDACSTATMPGQKCRVPSTPWSIASPAGWRRSLSCEPNFIPTPSPNTWPGSFLGQAQDRGHRIDSDYRRNSRAAVPAGSLVSLSPSMWIRLFPTVRRSAWYGKASATLWSAPGP